MFISLRHTLKYGACWRMCREIDFCNSNSIEVTQFIIAPWVKIFSTVPSSPSCPSLLLLPLLIYIHLRVCFLLHFTSVDIDSTSQLSLVYNILYLIHPTLINIYKIVSYSCTTSPATWEETPDTFFSLF